MNDLKKALGQCFFLSLLISVLIAGLLGLVLAQVGIFSLGSLLFVLAAYSVSCLAFIAAKGGGLSLSPPSIRFGWEEAIIIFLLCLSLFLYARPAEYILGWLDAGWYVNTGVHIAKTGSLTGENQTFSSLPASARSLFYSSFASLREMFPYFPDVASRGIYLWSFAVADPDRGELTAYHPPLFSVWIAIFYAIGGLRFGLYATPFFGALSVLSLYFAGKAMFDRKVGLLAAALLAVSFTQIYFSRTPYSEILSQFLLFSGIYALTTYIMERKPLYAAIAALSFGQAILSRIEGLIVVLPLAIFFGCWLVLKRSLPKDFRFFAIPFGLLLVDGAVLAFTASRPYVELNSYGLWFKLRSLFTESPAWLALSVISLGGLLVLIVLLGLFRPLGSKNESGLSRIYEGRHLMTTLLSLAILLLAIYAYFISRGETVVQLGQFVSPLGLWLGIFGLVELIRRGVNERTAFFLALVLIHGLASISVLAISTTLSYVYPIRRQVPMVIPSLILLASYAILVWNKEGKLLRVAQLIAIVILLASFLALDMPYVNYREMPNTIAFSEKLANYFGEQDVVVFEEMWAQDSRVGHFAAPLWTIYDKDTLLISTANAEEEAFSTAVAQWLDDGKGVYFVSQSDPPPLSLHGYELVPVAEERWLYSTITAKLVFPPEIREFEIPFYIYQIAEGEFL
ncbi:MAG: glycosyltransferase family 39 protein [Anaerolineales bacterium]|nr:glycosyltransferase family 39 protein [Anaerolineales bacterium]